MNSNVLPFPKVKPRKNDLDIPRYWCLPCDVNDLFKIGADGNVYCARCTARVRGLTVKDER